MPIYEYECRHCGETFEEIVSLSEADKTPECPFCNSTETQKCISVISSTSSFSLFSSSSSGGCSSGPGRRFT